MSVSSKGSSDPVLLWLWCRPAAAAAIRPLAWEPPYAESAALKRQKKKSPKPPKKTPPHLSFPDAPPPVLDPPPDLYSSPLPPPLTPSVTSALPRLSRLQLEGVFYRLCLNLQGVRAWTEVVPSSRNQRGCCFPRAIGAGGAASRTYSRGVVWVSRVGRFLQSEGTALLFF